MKKLLFVLMVLMCLTACGKPEAPSSVSPEPEPSPEPTFDLLEYENPAKLAKQSTRIGDYTCNVYVDHVEILEYHGRDAIVEIPETIHDIPVTVLGGGYFGLAEEIRFPEGLLAIKGGYFRRGLTEFPLPEGLKYLDLQAFADCDNLRSLTLPASLEVLQFPYFHSTALSELQVAEENPYFASQNGVVFDKAMETLLFCPRDRTGSYTVPTSVTRIAENAFMGCALSEIILPEGLREIGLSAFAECMELETLLLPKSLTDFNNVFSYTPALTSVQVAEGNPNFVSVDGVLYTKDMTQLLVYPMGKPEETFTVPDSVQTGWTQPTWNGYLKTLIIPACVEDSGIPDTDRPDLTLYFLGSAMDWYSLFAGCYEIPPVRLGDPDTPDPDWETSGDWTYTVQNGQATLQSYTGQETEITVPDTLEGFPVTAIGDRAFCFLGGKELYTSGSMQEWRARTFSVTLPEGVTEIGAQAFFGSNLSQLYLPSTVQTIGEDALTFCTYLSELTVAEGNPSFSAVDGALYSANGTTLLCVSNMTEPLPDSTAEASYSYRGSYILPAAVTEITSTAFLSCSKLERIDVEPNNSVYTGKDGVLSTLDGTLVCYPAAAPNRQIPEHVTSTAPWAFAHTFMPDRTAHLLRNITELGPGAFAWSRLSHAVIPEQITSIPADTFLGSRILAVTIPAGVAEIGPNAFLHCNDLADVYYGGTQEDWDNIAIASGNEPLKNAQIHYSQLE